MPPTVTKVVSQNQPGMAPRTVLGTGVLSKMKPVGFGKDDGISLLVYGIAGTGKTTFWSTFPDPILCITCSGGLYSGELRSIDTEENRRRINEIEVEHSSQIIEVADEISVNPEAFKTIVLEHGSGLQDLIIKEVGNMDEIPVAKFKKAGKGESWGVIGQSDWGQVATIFIQIVRKLLNLRKVNNKINIVIVAQERELPDKSKRTSQELVIPYVMGALTPMINQWLNPAVDYAVQTFKRPKMRVMKEIVGGKEVESGLVRDEGVEYCLRTGEHDIIYTKVRKPIGSGQLVQVIVDPNYTKLMKVIRGEKL